ncbi:MAG: TonB-dependent receptor [Bacteroidales bacterium]
MSRFFMLMRSMCLLLTTAQSQQFFTLNGSITDQKNEALPGAYILLSPLNSGASADGRGHYVIEDIPKGEYLVSVSFIGYKTLNDTLRIFENLKYDVKLSMSPLSLHEVVIIDDYTETRNREESLSLEIANEDYLKRHLGGSLMNSLERLPGISTIGIGSGQSKPVIRGLSFNRVVVVENNIKHEAQQWGSDHGLEVDQYAVERAEVIKGPASLRYGSDAIGGVIDIQNKKIPDNQTIGATIDLTGKSNSGFLGTSVSLFGRHNHFFATARFTLLDYGDFKVPADSVDIYSFRAALHNRQLRNTAGKEQNMHLSLGYIQNGFQSRLYMSNISLKNGFFANAHGLEPRRVDTALHDKSSRDIQYPYQEVNHFKLLNTSTLQLNKLMVSLDLGVQRNFRQEWSQYVDHGYMPAIFPDSLSFDRDLERQFDKLVYTSNIKLATLQSQQLHIETGVSAEYQDNGIDGRGFIIPAFRQFSSGAFFIMRHSFSVRSKLMAGIRFDYGEIHTSAYHDWFTSPVIENGDTLLRYLQRATKLNRSFANFTWSIGYTLQTEKWSFKSNLGKGFRMPIAKELAANGVNYHHFSYEVGDPDLEPEVSYQLDASLEYKALRFAIGLTPFVSYFTNYIYLNPSPEHDRLYGNGNQIFYYTQSRVLRYGAEIHAHHKISKALQLGLIGEYVFAEQLSGAKKGFTLPFSPPATAVFNLKYQPESSSALRNTYASLDYKVTSKQTHIVPPEESTAGFQLINLNLGGQINLKQQALNISLQVQNLLNTKYFNHTSYYRLINVPEAGRNFIVNISIPIDYKIK